MMNAREKATLRAIGEQMLELVDRQRRWLEMLWRIPARKD